MKKTEIESSVEVEVTENERILDPESVDTIISDLEEIALYCQSKIGRIKKIADADMKIQEAFQALQVVCTMARTSENKVYKIESEFNEGTSSGGGQVSASVYISGPADKVYR